MLMIRSGKLTPDNERWLHTERNAQRLDRAIKWVETTKRRDNFDEIVDIIEND